MHKYNFLYKTICNKTNKYYIGVHSTSNLNDGYLGSGKILINSLLKYGRDNHDRKILNFYDSKDSLYSAEKILVNEDLLLDPNCMNLKEGGIGGFDGVTFKGRVHSDLTKSKMRESSRLPSLGNKNSQFDTCWIFNSYQNKKIPKCELDKYLNSGWSKGRRMNLHK